MSRNRFGIVIAVLLVFVVVGAYLIFGNKSSGPQNLSFDVTVTKASSMVPSELNAHQNDTITINITSDTDGEVHLHGYDIAFDTKAGQVVSHTFKAINTGSFEIEWEETTTHLGELNVNP
jgi:hypothetical protein